MAPNVSDEFDKELSERRCWGLNHLRSYFRAVHGQASTLRKMGRYRESLKRYLLLEKLDPKFYRYCLNLLMISRAYLVIFAGVSFHLGTKKGPFITERTLNSWLVGQ